MICLRIKKASELLGGGKSLVDLGCGEGNSVLVFREKYKEIHGMDISGELKKARKKGMKVKQHNLNKKLPYKNSFFSDAICLDVIDYIKHPVEFLKEVNRIIVRGGFLIISIPNARNINQIMRIAKGRGPKSSDVQESWEDGHIHYFTGNDLENMLIKAGFEIKDKIALVDESSQAKLKIKIARVLLGRNLFREFVSGGIMIKAVKK